MGRADPHPHSDRMQTLWFEKGEVRLKARPVRAAGSGWADAVYVVKNKVTDSVFFHRIEMIDPKAGFPTTGAWKPQERQYGGAGCWK